jgi:valyl-tRNA synthetase
MMMNFLKKLNDEMKRFLHLIKISLKKSDRKKMMNEREKKQKFLHKLLKILILVPFLSDEIMVILENYEIVPLHIVILND